MFLSLPKLFSKFFPHVAKCHSHRQPNRARPQLEVLEDRVVPVVNAYIGASGGSWMDPMAWSQRHVPNGAETADIPAGAYCVLPSGSSDQAVAGTTVEGILTINAKLSSNNVSSTGTLNIGAGGELDVTSSGVLGGTGSISGDLETPSNITFGSGSAYTLLTGAQFTGGPFIIDGVLTDSTALVTSAQIVLDSGGTYPGASFTGTGSYDNFGEFDWDGGTLGLSGGVTLEGSSIFKTEDSAGKTLSAGTITSNSVEGTDLGGTGALDISSGAAFDDSYGKVLLSIPIVSPTMSKLPYGLFKVEPKATLEVDTVGPTKITSDFDNEGILNVGAGATLELSTLIGGPGGPSTVVLNGTLQLDGDLTLLGTLGTVSTTSGFTEQPYSGTLKIGDGTGIGTLEVDSGATASIQGNLEVTKTGTLTGGGTVANSGLLTMDIGSSNGTGGIGAYVASNSGRLDLQATSATTFSSLKVAGNAQLSGTLLLDFLNGYTPTKGTTFQLLTAGSIGAHFDQTPPNMTATYTPNSVSVTQD